MPASASVIANGGTTTAANTLTLSVPVTASVAAGTGVVANVAVRFLSGAPASPVVTDTKGNTYTLLDNGGVSQAPMSTHLSNITTALTTSDFITVTFSTNNADEIALTAYSTPGYSLASQGIGGMLSISSAATHSYGVAAGASTKFMLGADVSSGSPLSDYVSISGSTLINKGGSPARTIVSFYSNPGDTASHTTSVSWAAGHAGSMNNRAYVATALASFATANSGPDQTHAVGVLATLTSAGSTTAGGTSLTTYTWRIITKPGGSAAALSSTSAASPTITPDVAGNYIIGLTVTNSAGTTSAEDTMTITAIANTPNAGAPQSLTVAQADPQLDASLSAGFGGTGVWTLFSGPNGGTVTFANATAAVTTYTRPTVVGAYTFRWTRTDEAANAQHADVVHTYATAAVSAPAEEVFDGVTWG